MSEPRTVYTADPPATCARCHARVRDDAVQHNGATWHPDCAGRVVERLLDEALPLHTAIIAQVQGRPFYHSELRRDVDCVVCGARTTHDLEFLGAAPTTATGTVARFAFMCRGGHICFIALVRDGERFVLTGQAGGTWQQPDAEEG